MIIENLIFIGILIAIILLKKLLVSKMLFRETVYLVFCILDQIKFAVEFK